MLNLGRQEPVRTKRTCAFGIRPSRRPITGTTGGPGSFFAGGWVGRATGLVRVKLEEYLAAGRVATAEA